MQRLREYSFLQYKSAWRAYRPPPPLTSIFFPRRYSEIFFLIPPLQRLWTFPYLTIYFCLSLFLSPSLLFPSLFRSSSINFPPVLYLSPSFLQFLLILYPSSLSLCPSHPLSPTFPPLPPSLLQFLFFITLFPSSSMSPVKKHRP